MNTEVDKKSYLDLKRAFLDLERQEFLLRIENRSLKKDKNFYLKFFWFWFFSGVVLFLFLLVPCFEGMK